MGTTSQTIDSSSKSSGPAQDFKTKVQVAERQLERISHDAGARVGAAAREIAESADDYVETSRDYVKEHPIKSVAVAAAAGAVVGSLVTMAMSRSK